MWASRESDVAALERQRQIVESRLTNQVRNVEDELALMAKGYADSITGIVRSGDVEAFDGKGMTDVITSVFGYDEAFVVRPDGELAFQDDSDVAERYAWVRPLLNPLLERASGETTGQPPVVELMRLQGRPSIAGAVPITLDVEGATVPTTLFLVAYRYIDGRSLDNFSEQQGLNGARFARASDPEPNEVAFQIEATASNEPIGFIIWTPDLPGSTVVVRLIPALSIAALIVATLLALLILLLRRSVSDLQESERQARYQSKHDVLTGLPNRALFAATLQATLDDQRLSNKRSLVAIFDLDRFKSVNDTFGHNAGDELIRAVAERISGILEPGDLLARLGGDEFGLLLPDRAKQDRSYFDICNTIIEEIGRPFVLLDGAVNVSVGCSIGITSLLDMCHSASEALNFADLALYHAKSTGKGRCIEYTLVMHESVRLREELKADLRRFLENPHDDDDAFGLRVFYQTTHTAQPGHAISGAEALVRWQHEKHGLLTPDKFVSLAEDSGLIHKLGAYVLRQACAAAVTWPSDTFVSVNVSPIQLRSDDFTEDVLAILRETGLPPHRLELEVTETALMDGDELVVCATLSLLRAVGIKIALDDFGTGYSSLSHLVQFGIDRIKIDRSFVKLLGDRRDGAAVVSAVVALSHSLGIATTAEGVETSWQRDFLITAGCSDLQGYLFSRPLMSPDMFKDRPAAVQAG